MSERVRRIPPEKRTEFPGERMLITLDVSKLGLDVLLEGTDVQRVYLTANEDGTYSLHTDNTIGETRRQGVKPYVDVLTEALNGFAETLEAYAPEIPDAVNEAWDAAVERVERYSGERRSEAS